MSTVTVHSGDTYASMPTALTLPVLDLGPYLRHEAGALQYLAGALCEALEHVGFFFIINHGIPQTLIDRIFAEAARFHALPLEEKMALSLSASNTGISHSGTAAVASPHSVAIRDPISTLPSL